MKTIQDEFTDLPVSKQRKTQLRNKRDGKCQTCGKPLFSTMYCEKHHIAHHERQRKRKGCVSRNAWSKYKDGIKRPTLGDLAYEMKLSGASWESIAVAMGTSPESAYGCARHYAKRNNLTVIGKHENGRTN